VVDYKFELTAAERRYMAPLTAPLLPDANDTLEASTITSFLA
jgi:hypothetical protein